MMIVRFSLLPAMSLITTHSKHLHRTPSVQPLIGYYKKPDASLRALEISFPLLPFITYCSPDLLPKTVVWLEADTTVERTFICELVAVVDDVLSSFVCRPSPVACGIFICNFVQIYYEKIMVYAIIAGVSGGDIYRKKRPTTRNRSGYSILFSWKR